MKFIIFYTHLLLNLGIDLEIPGDTMSLKRYTFKLNHYVKQFQFFTNFINKTRSVLLAALLDSYTWPTES